MLHRAARASGAPRWRRDAEHIARLCARSFLHAESGELLEYFDVELQPLEGEDGQVVEPGHCFEWARLFDTLADWGAPDAALVSDRMAAFARRHGLDPVRCVAINEVLTDGRVRNAAARLWPQSERLKAALARYRRTGEEDELYAGLVKYFETPRRGAWRDKLKPDGSWVEEPAPGSSMYHITSALAELLDTAGGSRRAARGTPPGGRDAARGA